MAWKGNPYPLSRAAADAIHGGPGTRKEDIDSMKTAGILCVLLITPFPFNADAQPTCCARAVALTTIGESLLDWTFESVLHRDSKSSDCHNYDVMFFEGQEKLRRIDDAIGSLHGAEPDPEAQRIFSEMLGLDYVFRGELVVTEEGDSYHNSLKMRFVDQQRGQVVKEGRASWTGFKGSGGSEAVAALAASFLPLDELMYDHERIPETATVQAQRDPIESDDRMTIHVREILDGKGRNSQPWQQVLVKTEKGKILNGTPQGEGYRRFKVGDGSIDLVYEAPDECRRQTETISIYNSCTNDFRTDVNFVPEREIATGSFEIHCEPRTVWTGTVKYVRGFNEVHREQGPGGSTVETHEIVNEKADLQIHAWPYCHSYEGSVGTDLYYEGAENSVTGSYAGSYKKITTIQSAEGTSTITDSALCQGMIRDTGYLVINNEEMKASLELGLSFVGDRPCRGQTVYAGARGSATLDFDWDQHLTFAGQGSLESNIPARNPQTVTGSYSLPEWGITWTWNLTLSGR
jgi:hypothetical protein